METTASPGYPEVEAVLNVLHEALSIPDRAAGLAGTSDAAFLSALLDRWRLVADASRSLRQAHPRALYRYTDPAGEPVDWWLLVTSATSLRLLHDREWCPDGNLPDLIARGAVTFRTGTDADLIAEAVAEHRHGRLATDVLGWLLDRLPGPTAEAERVMLGLWFRG